MGKKKSKKGQNRRESALRDMLAAHGQVLIDSQTVLAETMVTSTEAGGKNGEQYVTTESIHTIRVPRINLRMLKLKRVTIEPDGKGTSKASTSEKKGWSGSALGSRSIYLGG